MNSRARFPELDLLRFIAACGVMVFHYTYFGPRNHILPVSYPVLGQIGKYGFLGVDVFFILSGFVILLTAYEKDAIAFTVARMVRLYPAYWICVTLTAAAIVVTRSLPATVTPFQYLANLTMVHGFFGIRDVSGVYWTLSVEIQFYFLIFVVLLFGQARRIGYLLGLWLLASIILSLQEPHGIVRFFLFPQWSSYFVAGAMLFLIHREGPSLYKLSVVGACYVLSVAYAINLLPFGAGRLETDFSAPVIASALAISYATFLAIALRPRAGGAILSVANPQRYSWLRTRIGQIVAQKPAECGVQAAPHRPTARTLPNVIKLVGLITYPLYLLHQDIGYIVLRSAPGLNPLLLLIIVMAAMIVLAWVVHIGPEKWLASGLKWLLARPESIAISAKSFIAECFGQSGWKQTLRVIRAALSRKVSTVPLTPQPVPASAANSQATQSQIPHAILPATVSNPSPPSPAAS